MKENVRFWSKYRVITTYFDHVMKWNPVMKVWKIFKKLGVDVDEIWRKMLGFGVCIGLLPNILIISWNEIQLWRFERNWSWCWWNMKENVRFWSKYRVVTPYFDHLMKWNPVMKFWKFGRNQSWCWWDMKENVRFWSMYRLVTPYFDCLIKWNTVMKVERNRSWCWWDMKDNVRFWRMYRVITTYFDHLMKWNPVMKVWKFERNRSWCWWDMKEKCLGFGVSG